MHKNIDRLISILENHTELKNFECHKNSLLVINLKSYGDRPVAQEELNQLKYVFDSYFSEKTKALILGNVDDIQELWKMENKISFLKEAMQACEVSPHLVAQVVDDLLRQQQQFVR